MIVDAYGAWVYRMTAICAVCGHEYGEHRATDDRCPPDYDEETTIDCKTKWCETKFTLAIVDTGTLPKEE